MNDQKSQIPRNQVHKQEDAPKSTEAAMANKPSSWKRLLAKKWVFPATYIIAAAIILSLMWVYQDSGTKNLSEQDPGLNIVNENPGLSGIINGLDEALPVTVPAESMNWPVENRSEVEVAMPFYESTGTNEEKLEAMIEYGNTLMPNTGISLAREDNLTFNVQAAMSGKVTRVENVPLIGNLVEITHDNGLKTIYESLDDVIVTKDSDVKQGDIIAKAGRNELEKALGIHLHFEVRQDDILINPETFIKP
ncbi:MAG TPA: M23 family metallopeptidase [Bacilli bacterium]